MFHIRGPVQVLDALFPLKLHADVPGKVGETGQTTYDRPRWSSRLLVSAAWPSPNYCAHVGVNQSIKKILSVPVSVALPLKYSFKISNILRNI